MIYIDDNKNKTWYGAVFCTSEWKDGVTSNITIPCKPQSNSPYSKDANVYFYSILYNFTLLPSYFLDNFTAPIKLEPSMLILKNSIDSGIIDYLKQKNSTNFDDNYGLEFEDDHQFKDELLDIHINATWGHWPLTASRIFTDANIVSLVGSFYYALGPCVTFVIILTEVVKEKEMKLRQGLNVVGLSHISYWLHWLITGMFFSAITSLMSILAGLACQFDLFYNADFFIVWFLFFIFSIAMILLAFIIST